MAELQKKVGYFSLPQQTDPKWEVTMHHGLGQDVVYSVFDDKARTEVRVQDVVVGHGFLKLKFLSLRPLEVKVVVIG